MVVDAHRIVRYIFMEVDEREILILLNTTAQGIAFQYIFEGFFVSDWPESPLHIFHDLFYYTDALNLTKQPEPVS